MAVDAVNNEIVVTNQGNNSITVHARTAYGNVAPLRTIVGAATSLSQPFGLSVDPINDEIAVANLSNNSVTVYARTGSGNAAPIRTITGATTTLVAPFFLAEVVGGVPPPTSTPTVTSTPPTTPTSTPTVPGVSPTPGGAVTVPMLDARGLVALALILAAIGAVAIRKISS